MNSASNKLDAKSCVGVRNSTRLKYLLKRKSHWLIECTYLSVGFDSCSISGGGVPLRGHISFGCLGAHCLRRVCASRKANEKEKLKKSGFGLIQPQGELRILLWSDEKGSLFLEKGSKVPSAAPTVRLNTPAERDPLNWTPVERSPSTYSGFAVPPVGGAGARLSNHSAA